MKKTIFWLGLLFVGFHTAFAQTNYESSFKDENVISGNVGFTTIGEQTFVGFRLQPEFSFGKIGLGLDVPLLFDIENGNLRTEEFSNGVGVLRMIRYLRYGVKKEDPVYVKLGDMTGERLGYGAILGNYTNAVSFERRKVGISADLLFEKKIGLEFLYSDLNFDGSLKLLAVRPYYKPFGALEIPIVNTIEFGLSMVVDKDDFEETTDTGTTNHTQFTRDGNKAYGVDVGAILLKNMFLELTADIQYAKLLKNDALAAHISNTVPTANYDTGQGYAIGLEGGFNFIANVLHVNARIERQWYGDNYIPQFFNFAYEINKDARLQELVPAENSQGIYARLGSEILDLVKVKGELLLPDDLENSNRGAIVGLSLQTKEIANFRVRGTYVKSQLTNLDDAFKFNGNALANALVTYRLNQFMEAGVDYQWTYAQKDDGTFGTVNQVRPYIGFSMKF
ncbi:hypothetical protein [Ochrovirga pacifica]|uniref:hypothetical protein n=1 Tax=Ochrovirga pacifica TaxID=1042376 RepID=UPI0002558EA2|nr:hypothetical protein [Ochrovirga pacifica]